VLEKIPIVFSPSDIGMHNGIVTANNPSEIVDIIDWEFCASVIIQELEVVVGGYDNFVYIKTCF
jgi:hypothetical protein